MALDVLHRKIGIILTTIEYINEFGIQNVSTREVAKRLGISEATIFKHFKTKNDLLLQVLDYYSQYDSDIIISALERKEDVNEAIIFFINSFAEYYENYPSITAITQAYDVLSCDIELGNKIRGISESRTSLMRELLEHAKNNGKIDSGIDTDKLVDIIFGSFRSICLKWRLNQYSFSLKKYTLSTLNMILNAFIIDLKES